VKNHRAHLLEVSHALHRSGISENLGQIRLELLSHTATIRRLVGWYEDRWPFEGDRSQPLKTSGLDFARASEFFNASTVICARMAACARF
jgi:hypothetical protein